jgi:hypothetical protein
MPKATTNINDTERHELKTCPPDGFVLLRRMNYGEMLERRAQTGKLNLNTGKDQSTEAFIQMANRLVTEFEFRTCIMDHNLTDDNDNPLDFRKPTTLNMLDPRVGDEISDLINKMNQAEVTSESLGNSKNGSIATSSLT